MANLLPQQLKKDSHREYVLRTVFVGLCALSVLLLVGVVSLVPTYVLLDAKLSGTNKTSGLPDSKTATTSTDSIQIVRSYVSLLKQDTSSNEVPYGIFTQILKIKSDTLEFSRISFTRSDNTLHVGGKAATRSDLKNFIDRVGQDDMFMPIDNFPYSDLSGHKDIPFNFNIQLKKTQP